jgi:type IV pilus assembly protein PilA
MFKSLKRSEKGFTLIELLVVITILGVLAAVVIPQLVSFIGRGKVEAANTEAHQVALAVVAAMTELNTATNTFTSVGPALAGQASGANNDPYDFLATPSGLQATYTFNGAGNITAATIVANGKWTGLTWGTSGWVQGTPPST